MVAKHNPHRKIFSFIGFYNIKIIKKFAPQDSFFNLTRIFLHWNDS